MNGFDWAIVALFITSIIFAFVRGFTRQVIALFSWVLGFFAALAFSPWLGGLLPEIGGHPSLRYVVAFGAIMIAALVVGGLVAWPLRSLLHKTGMGFLDRFLGGLFGIVRGVVLVLLVTLAVGLSTLPREDWWQNSLLAPPLAAAAMALKPWLPGEWAARLDFSRDGRATPVAPADRKV